MGKFKAWLKKPRLWIVASTVYFLLSLAHIIDETTKGIRYNNRVTLIDFHMPNFFQYLIFITVPLVVIWGIWWIGRDDD